MINIIYRIRQWIFSLTLRLFEHISPSIYEGADSLLKVNDICKENNIKHIFLLTTPGTLKRKTIDHLFTALDNNDIKYTIYSEVPPDPTIEFIEKGLTLYIENKCEAFVCVGGGSVIDCGKAIAARVARPNKTIPQMKGLLKVFKKLPILIAVPTTAGTGSEVTAAAVVTDERNGTHYKYPISDFCLIPRYAILDPKLTISLPAKMSVTTGMDALTHAIEAYTNLFVSKYVEEKALAACDLLFNNIDIVAKDPTNLIARNNMLLGSMYAGVAFTNNFVGNVHAIAHAIGGIYGVSHGEANSILLAPILKYYGETIEDKLVKIADYCNIGGIDNKQKALNVIKRIEEIRDNNSIGKTFAKLDEKDYNEIIERALSEANPSYPVPVILNSIDVKNILNMVKE